MKIKRLIGIIAGAIAVLAFGIVSKHVELERMARPLPGATVSTGSSPILDQALMIDDVRRLASTEFAGRKTGSAGSRLARAMLVERFQSIGITPFPSLGNTFLQPFSFTHHSIKGLIRPGGTYETIYADAANVIGFIPGSESPLRVLVISAHYDHLGFRNGALYPGADDNASGVAVMVAMAAYFKANPPRNTVVFAAFDAEELGLRGAKAFVANLPFPKEQLVMNLNLDMVSHNDRNEIFVAGLYHSPFLLPYLEQATRTSRVNLLSGHDRPTLLTGLIENWTDSSDHSPFHDAGIPFLYLGVDDHPDYHAPSDTFERLNRQFLGEAGELILQVALVLDQNLQKIAQAKDR